MRAVKLALAILLAFSASLITACDRQSETQVIVSGSTSVQPYVEILAEEYMQQHSGLEIDVQGGGSSAGIKAVEAGIADIGMSSRALKEDEQHLWSMEFAIDGLAMIVHPQNPVNNLTLNQIRDIYSGRITNWKQVGGSDAPIHLIAREEGSGTRSAFEDLVMGKDRITPRSIVQSSNGAVRQLVSGDKNAIGFISLGIVDDTVKAIRLDGVEATAENILNGSYSLYRYFLFIAKEKPHGLAAQFIDYVLSPQGMEHLIREGLIPVTNGSASSTANGGANGTANGGANGGANSSANSTASSTANGSSR